MEILRPLVNQKACPVYSSTTGRNDTTNQAHTFLLVCLGPKFVKRCITGEAYRSKYVFSVHFPFVPTSPRLGFRHRSPSIGLGLRPHPSSPIQHLRLVSQLSMQGCPLVTPKRLTMAITRNGILKLFEAFFVRKTAV